MNTESAKKLREYLGSPKWMRIVVLALLTVTLVSLLGGILLISKDTDPASAIEFYPADDEMKHKYVFMDVTGVSDYVASYGDTDKWYIALDPYGYGSCLSWIIHSSSASASMSTGGTPTRIIT